MRGNLGDKARISHILEAINEIDNYLIGIDYRSFTNNSMMRFACVKQVEIIGEASINISSDLKINFKTLLGNK